MVFSTTKTNLGEHRIIEPCAYHTQRQWEEGFCVFPQSPNKHYGIPVIMAAVSFFFHASATSLASGSSGFGALRRAWMERRTVRIWRAGLHLSVTIKRKAHSIHSQNKAPTKTQWCSSETKATTCSHGNHFYTWQPTPFWRKTNSKQQSTITKSGKSVLSHQVGTSQYYFTSTSRISWTSVSLCYMRKS